MTERGLSTKNGPFLPRAPDMYTSREIVWRDKSGSWILDNIQSWHLFTRQLTVPMSFMSHALKYIQLSAITVTSLSCGNMLQLLNISSSVLGNISIKICYWYTVQTISKWWPKVSVSVLYALVSAHSSNFQVHQVCQCTIQVSLDTECIKRSHYGMSINMNQILPLLSVAVTLWQSTFWIKHIQNCFKD